MKVGNPVSATKGRKQCFTQVHKPSFKPECFFWLVNLVMMTLSKHTTCNISLSTKVFKSEHQNMSDPAHEMLDVPNSATGILGVDLNLGTHIYSGYLTAVYMPVSSKKDLTHSPYLLVEALMFVEPSRMVLI